LIKLKAFVTIKYAASDIQSIMLGTLDAVNIAPSGKDFSIH
jgi:hypothetical protein